MSRRLTTSEIEESHPECAWIILDSALIAHKLLDSGCGETSRSRERAY